MIEVNRRNFIGGIVTALAAPAIVKSGVLMPIRVIEPPRIVIKPPDGSLWCTSNGETYRYNANTDLWHRLRTEMLLSLSNRES